MSTPLAYFGINSSGLTLAIDLLIVFAVVLYLSLVYWTVQDARRRIAERSLVGCAFVISLVPFLGPLIYAVLRPPEYLDDVNQRELETRAAEARLHDLDYRLCPHCDYPIERDFLRCPSCLRRLKERCTSCSAPLDPAWTICPYCEVQVPGAITPRRSRRDGDRRGGSQRERERERLPLTERPYTPAGERDRTSPSRSLISEETQVITGDPFASDDFQTELDEHDRGTRPRARPSIAPEPAPRGRSRRPPRAGD